MRQLLSLLIISSDGYPILEFFVDRIGSYLSHTCRKSIHRLPKVLHLYFSFDISVFVYGIIFFKSQVIKSTSRFFLNTSLLRLIYQFQSPICRLLVSSIIHLLEPEMFLLLSTFSRTESKPSLLVFGVNRHILEYCLLLVCLVAMLSLNWNCYRD
jgi:hypothetical protein